MMGDVQRQTTDWPDTSYEHQNIDEPAILLGGAFAVDTDEKGMPTS